MSDVEADMSSAPAPAPAPRAAPAPAATPARRLTLDSLLHLRPEGTKALAVSTLTTIPFQSHVNTRLMLRKSLVGKVVTLVEAERSEREHKARAGEEDEGKASSYR
ncbi:hypothetical protein FIBSPDRAFT_863257 [Athelia psychrophila]|uniref:Uncharacterized protein n=1 Tax=Athelia psychrophila TaxID=1759441 RepID=A0A166HIX6_9AGAM|nr:hypothetical protein FIBSPDRAFT_863257 [Fibularhizoctonia sp. CBS 109695]